MNANEEEIKKAYRKRAMVHHPDRHAGATEVEKKDHEQKFKEVGEAYAILSDEKNHRLYDSGQDMEDGGGGGGFHEVDPNSIFQAFFGGGAGGMGGMGGHPGMGGHHFHMGGAPGGNQSFSFQFGYEVGNPPSAFCAASSLRAVLPIFARTALATNSVILIGSISRLCVSLEMINKPILYLPISARTAP